MLANRKIIAVVDDMFFASKIRATAESLGVDVKFVRSAKQLAAASGEKPDLVIVDLQAQKIDALTVPETFKAEGATPVQLLGFFSHVETELQRAAITAGYERVIPRSVFARDLAVILRGD